MNLEAAAARRVIPVAVIDDAESAVPLAGALLSGGLDVIEIALRTPASEEAVDRIVRAFPDMLVGAGTLLHPTQVERARDLGAKFGAAPGHNSAVVASARAIGLPFMPGVMTPSEVEAAAADGCGILKFFPASIAGGLPMLRALAGPYAQTGVKLVVFGGVTPANMTEFLRLSIVGAVGGSWIVDPSLITGHAWSEITRRAREAVAIAAAAGTSSGGRQ